MKSQILIAVCFTFIVTVTANTNLIPCVQCSGVYDPVCAIPTEDNLNGGSARTFRNSCAVEAMDCFQTKRRKFR